MAKLLLNIKFGIYRYKGSSFIPYIAVYRTFCLISLFFKLKVMPEEKELSFWEKAVGLTFNHWEGEIFEKINKTKTLFAELIDLVNLNWDMQNWTYMSNLLRGMATKSCITAQMAVVKFITWKD